MDAQHRSASLCVSACLYESVSSAATPDAADRSRPAGRHERRHRDVTVSLHQWLPLTYATVDTVSGVSHTDRPVSLAVSRLAASMTQYSDGEKYSPQA